MHSLASRTVRPATIVCPSTFTLSCLWAPSLANCCPALSDCECLSQYPLSFTLHVYGFICMLLRFVSLLKFSRQLFLVFHSSLIMTHIISLSLSFAVCVCLSLSDSFSLVLSLHPPPTHTFSLFVVSLPLPSASPHPFPCPFPLTAHRQRRGTAPVRGMTF